MVGHTNDNKFPKLFLSNSVKAIMSVSPERRASRAAGCWNIVPPVPTLRVNVVMRAREPGARKLVFFKLLPSRKPGQESYNCIPPPPPSICDLLIYWRSVGGVLRQYVANYPSKRTRKGRLKQNTI